MTLSEARNLITTQAINAETSQNWADLGCGSGLFSRALLSLLPSGSTVYAVDNRSHTFAEPGIAFIQADFEKEPLPFPPLDGIIMANSLHFVEDKLRMLQKLGTYLKPGAIFILVEYDTDAGNRWVPYPVKFSSAGRLFTEAGFGILERIAERRSVYNRAKIYSAWCRLESGGKDD